MGVSGKKLPTSPQGHTILCAFPGTSQALLFLLSFLSPPERQGSGSAQFASFVNKVRLFLSQLEFPSMSDSIYFVVFGLGMRRELFSSCLFLLWFTLGLLK